MNLADIFSGIDSQKRRAAAFAQGLRDVGPKEMLQQHFAGVNEQAGENLDLLRNGYVDQQGRPTLDPSQWSPQAAGMHSNLVNQAAGAMMPGALGGNKALAGMVNQEEMGGILRGQASNTFTGQAPGAGRMVGMTQPKGTPVDKLFSNFADASTSSPSQQEAFRAAMLQRALRNPAQFTKDNIRSTTQPFKDGLTIRTDAASKGYTRVQVLDGDTPVASANIRNGMLDSIATDSAAKGRGIGADLLKYLDDNNLANIHEVPDRSPGFVNIQKKVLGGK